MITNLKIDEERKRLYYQQGYWTEETLYDVWNRQARACADREYVVDDRGNRYTYAYVDDAAARLASWLKDSASKRATWSASRCPYGRSSASCTSHA